MNTIREQDVDKIVSGISKNYCKGTFLITGATGFLGSYIVDTLMYMNKQYSNISCNIIAVCRNKRKSEMMFREYLGEKCFKLLIQELDKEIIIEEDVDWMIHAASSAVTSSFDKIPVDILGVNMVGTYNLLKLAKRKRVKGFLYFSSGAVYGNVKNGITKIKEEDVFPLEFYNIKNSYAVGKEGGEALCRAFWAQYDIPSKIVRIYHTYGPGIDPNDERVFADFSTKIYKRENLVIKGNGNDARSFCYITDAIIAFFLILFKGADGECYNMANNKETYTIYELARILVDKAFPDRGLSIIAENLELHNGNSKWLADTTKLRGLGWKPQIDVAEGFQRMVKYFELQEKNA